MKRLSILLFFIALMMPPCHEPGTCMAQQYSDNQVAKLTMPMVGGSVPVAGVGFPTTAVIDDFTCSSDENPPDGWSQYTAGITTEADTDDIKGADADGGLIYKVISWGPISSPGVEAYMTYKTVSAGYATVTIVDGSNNGYLFVMNKGTDYITVRRVVGGTPTTIIYEPVTWGSGDVGGMKIVGSGANNLVSAYRKPSGGSWAQVGSTYTDESAPTQGTMTIVLINISNNNEIFDDLGGGTVVP